MHIETNCTHCFRKYTLDEKYLDKRIRCKACGEPFRVVAEIEEEIEDYDAPSYDRTTPVVRRRRKKSPGSGMAVPILTGLACFVGLAGFIGLVVFAVKFAPRFMTGQHEAILAQVTDYVEEVADLLESVKSKADVDRVASRFTQIGNEMAELVERGRELDKEHPIAKVKADQLEAKFKPRLEAAQSRIVAAARRIGTNPDLQGLANPLLGMQSSIRSAQLKARSEQFRESARKAQERMQQDVARNRQQQAEITRSHQAAMQRAREQADAAQRQAEADIAAMQQQQEAESRRQQQNQQRFGGNSGFPGMPPGGMPSGPGRSGGFGGSRGPSGPGGRAGGFRPPNVPRPNIPRPNFPGR